VKALVHDNDILCELWHKRLGHLHYGALPFLKDMVQGLLDFKVEKKGVCKGRVHDKPVKATLPSNEDRSREILDPIHLDVCGPMSLASSMKSWIYCMKTKDKVLGKFKEFKARVENRIGKKIKVSSTSWEVTHNLTKLLLSELVMIDLEYMVEFDD
jgi:hypothetical protein